jgi:hypothetical protein
MRTETADIPEVASWRSTARLARASGTASSSGVSGTLAKTKRSTPEFLARVISSV